MAQAPLLGLGEVAGEAGNHGFAQKEDVAEEKVEGGAVGCGGADGAFGDDDVVFLDETGDGGDGAGGGFGGLGDEGVLAGGVAGAEVGARDVPYDVFSEQREDALATGLVEGLKPRDRVRFEMDGDDVRLKPAPSRIAHHFGVVSAPGPALDSRPERELFEEGVAREASTEGR